MACVWKGGAEGETCGAGGFWMEGEADAGARDATAEPSGLWFGRRSGEQLEGVEGSSWDAEAWRMCKGGAEGGAEGRAQGSSEQAVRGG